VAAECNGFGLLTSSVLVAAVLGFLYRLDGLGKAGLLLLAVPMAILFNTLRIVGICLAATHVALPYDLVHEGIGAVFYAAALGLLWLLAASRAGPEPE
jgi:exosortase/archaeosortase family protein